MVRFPATVTSLARVAPVAVESMVRLLKERPAAWVIDAVAPVMTIVPVVGANVVDASLKLAPTLCAYGPSAKVPLPERARVFVTSQIPLAVWVPVPESVRLA